MSDMSRPGPRPPAAPDHERHDALLVAQFVAGDPLDPEQRAEAQHLVAGCAVCAALAMDLPAVSRAVAQEPVPPRRRDFRLSPEQAEELRGNTLTRFLRKLSLPRSRAFQPAAAGVLSIGLLFVVAGYAWPDGGTVVVQAEPNFVDWSSPAATSAAPREEAAEAPAPGLVESAPAADAALDGAEELMESEFADSLAESQAGTSEGLMQKSLPSDDADRLAEDADELAEVSARSIAPNSVVGDEEAEGVATVASDIEAPTDDRPEDLLIVLGLALALGGGGLLLLGWLARRARDPLAP